MTTTSFVPVCVTTSPESGIHLAPEPFPSADDSDVSRLGTFGRLVLIHRCNEILLRELRRVDSRLGTTHAYLAAPGCNSPLALAHLRQLRARRSSALALLNANALEARDLLSHSNDDRIPG